MSDTNLNNEELTKLPVETNRYYTSEISLACFSVVPPFGLDMGDSKQNSSHSEQPVSWFNFLDVCHLEVTCSKEH